MRKYPIWLYHEKKCFDGIIARSEEHEKALVKEFGEGWVESPLQYGKEEKKVEAPKSESKKGKSKQVEASA